MRAEPTRCSRRRCRRRAVRLTSFMSSQTSRLRSRAAQQVRRMKRRNQLRAAVVEARGRAAARSDRASCSSVCARERAERDDHLRLDDVDLPEQERLARRDLVRLRIAVLRRPALDHVGDVDVVARQLDRLDDLRQQLARRGRRTACPGCLRRRPAPRRRTSGPRSGLPTPNTICRRPSVCSLQRVQSPMSRADGRRAPRPRSRAPATTGAGAAWRPTAARVGSASVRRRALGVRAPGRSRG